METKHIIAIAIAIAVGAVTMSTVLVPAVSMGTDTEDTFTNEGYFRMTHFDNTGEHTISWTYEKPSIITVDGEDVTIGYAKNANITVVADTDWLIRYYTDGNGQGRAIRYIPATGNTIDALSDMNQTVSITLNAGVMSGTIATSSISGTYTDIYAPANDGDYTMKKSDKTAFVLNDSTIFGFGLTTIDANPGTYQAGFRFVGNYEDGVTGDVWRGTNTTVSDISMNVTKVNDHKDLYVFDSITATATHTDTVDDESVDTTTDITYNYVIVPYEVTAEKSIHASAPVIQIFNMLPIFVALGLIVTVIGVAYVKYRR